MDAIPGPSPNPASRVALHLEVTDPEVAAALLRVPEGSERERYALAALRLGVLSLRMAGGHLDATAIREAGERLLADLQALLAERARDLTSRIEGELRLYFDPRAGSLPQRIESFVKKDGELERTLRQHLGGDESVLARTLARHVGEQSPIFRLLSPTESGGLLSQMQKVIGDALAEQREEVLRQFSLDRDDSALSRLVQRVEAARRAIADEFSTDNEKSALSRIQKLLSETSREVERNLTLDDEGSALSRLKREIQGALAELDRKNADFHAEVRATLSALQARKEEGRRSTRHGLAFEEALGALLASEAQRLGDIHEATGNTTGSIRNCKVGDHLTRLGPESPAPAARIVWEAKEVQGYTLPAALEEIETARKNRDAQVGVFVFSAPFAPPGLEPFGRYGKDVVIAWDAEDPSTDLRVRAALGVARALVLREEHETREAGEAIDAVHEAARAVEKQVRHLEEFRTWGGTVRDHGEKISRRAEAMAEELRRQVERLDEQVRALRAPGPAGA